MSFIYGNKKLKETLFRPPKYQYFIPHIFKDILKLFSKNSSFAIIDKYGLVYLFEVEWVFFSIEQILAQKYINDSK